MATLSANQIAAIIKELGGPPEGTTCDQWVALALRESSGRTDARNSRPCSPQGHHANGILQFCENTLDRASALNPRVAFQKGFDLYRQRGWQPWAASHAPTPASVRACVEAGGIAHGVGIGDVPGLAAGLITDPAEAIQFLADSITKPFKAIIEFLNRIGEWITDRHNWIRVAMVIGGLGLGVVAFDMFSENVTGVSLQDEGVKAAKKVVTKGVA